MWLETLFVKARTEVSFASSRNYQILSGDYEEDRDYVDTNAGAAAENGGEGQTAGGVSTRKNVGERALPDPWTSEEDAELEERMSLYVSFSLSLLSICVYLPFPF